MWNRPNYSSADRETLIERITQLENEAGMGFSTHPRYNLTGYENAILGVLLNAKAAVITKEYVFDALYGMDDDMPGQKILDVWICKLRKKLAPYDIAIQTAWGRGWYIEPEDRAKILALAEQAKPELEVEGVAA